MADKKKYIKIRGASEHNLKNIDIEIPRDEFTVITGLSGSGKSSLAFDTIYAEGQRRYMESLSSYARQFLGQMEKPQVESIEGLPPAISIDQKSTNRNPRSTVGTVTEIYDYMRLLYARAGVPHCPKCGKHSITISRGIEVGNIFQLGTKYSKAMGFKYTDENGDEQYPIMGCYGIGVGRMAASICEVRHDDYGPIWPITIAPWQVHLCCLRSDDAKCKELADNLYNTLQNKGIEVIYDDRKVRPGAMFADADLLGVPVRVVVSPRNLEENAVEISTRDKQIDKQKTPVDNAVAEVERIIKKLTDDIYAEVK